MCVYDARCGLQLTRCLINRGTAEVHGYVTGLCTEMDIAMSLVELSRGTLLVFRDIALQTPVFLNQPHCQLGSARFQFAHFGKHAVSDDTAF